jgi:hypothetical protein
MGQHKLQSSSRIAAADWLAPRLAPFHSYTVAAVVPSGFPAYIRILHPARGPHDARLRWADVAARSGRAMHRLVQLDAINRPPIATPPESGNLPPDLLSAASAALAVHTTTPDRCWFCLWIGYGWLHPGSASRIVFRPAGASLIPDEPPAPLSRFAPAPGQNVPLVHFPQRDYLLFEGPLDSTTELGWNLTEAHFVPQSPNLFWPDDHAWCVASEIDLFCTLVAGPEALAQTLLADPRLEAWRVFPDDSVTADSDRQNA